MRTTNGIGITFSKRSHATHDDSQLSKTNLQIIPFNNSDIQLHGEEDYNIVIDCDIVKSMTDKPLKGGNDHEPITNFEPSSLQGESHMELAVVEKNEESKTVISLEDGECTRIDAWEMGCAVIHYGYEWRYDGGGKGHTLLFNEEGYIRRSCG